MKKILITGAEGFVGKHLVNILKNEYFIIGTSRSEKMEDEENLKYHNGDILDTNFITELLEKYQPEVIIHLAAIAITWSDDYKQLFDINLFGTINIFESVLKRNSQNGYNPKILYISSSDVYGKTLHPENVKEDDPFYPINYYSVTKISADRISYQYSQHHKLNVLIARSFNHAGPGQRKGFFVPDMASQIVEIEKDPTRDTLMVGNTDSVKDFTDVRDIVRAYKLLIEKDIPSGEAINVSSNRGIKFEDILQKLIQLAKKEIIIKKDESRMRRSEISVLIGNNQKLVKYTDWQPEININQTLKDTLDYWRVQVKG